MSATLDFQTETPGDAYRLNSNVRLQQASRHGADTPRRLSPQQPFIKERAHHG